MVTQRIKWFSLSIVILLFHLNIVLCKNFTKIRISKRTPLLVFPPTSPTRIQYIAGIGVPVEDLNFESITTGYVFKAEYYLPTTPLELRTPSSLQIGKRSLNRKQYDPKKERSNEAFFDANGENIDLNGYSSPLKVKQNDLSKYRWTIYKGIELMANRIGFIGRACVLRSICESAETPFHHHGGLLAELMHILMSPSTSVDNIVHHSDNEYFYAEKTGESSKRKTGAACHQIFKECKVSLLGMFSTIYEPEVPNVFNSEQF